MLLISFWSLYGIRWENFANIPSPKTWEIAGSVLFGHAWRLLALLWLGAVLAGTGRLLLRRLGVSERDPWQEIALSFGLGCGAWGTALLLLGLVGLWRPWLMILLTILASVPAFFELKSLFKEARGDALWPDRPWLWAALAAVLAVWLLRLPHSLIPETFYDAQEYHLGLPGLFLNRHFIGATPENSFAGIPSIPMMLYGWTMALDRWGILAQLIHNAGALWVAVAVLALCRRLGSPRAGWVAAAIFMLTPVVGTASMRVSVGLEWALFQILCFSSIVAASEEKTGSDARKRRLILSGCFLGFALACKYPAWFVPLAIAAALWHYRRDENGFSKREAALLFAVAGVWLAPWILKNIAFYGNPIWPFFQERLWPGDFFKPDWHYLSAGGNLDLRKTFFTAEGFKRYLFHPFMFSRHAHEFGGAIGPVYFGLLPLLFLVPAGRSARLLGLLCLYAWLPLSLISEVTRYFIPVLAPLAALLAAGLLRIENRPVRRRLGALFGAALAGIGLAYAAMNVPRLQNLDVLLGGRSFWSYLSRTNMPAYYPTPPHSGFQYIHQKTDAEAKVLIFGDGRHFPLWRDHFASTPDQVSMLELWSNASPDAAALRKRFADAGIEWILVNHGEIFRNREEFSFTEPGMDTLNAFWKKYTLKEFESGANQDHWVQVYRVLGEDEAAKPHPFTDLWKAYRIRR